MEGFRQAAIDAISKVTWTPPQVLTPLHHKLGDLSGKVYRVKLFMFIDHFLLLISSASLVMNDQFWLLFPLEFCSHGKVVLKVSNCIMFFQAEKRIVSMTSSRSDWCISRQRTWGVPVPVFYHVETKEPLVNEETIDHIKCRALESADVFALSVL